MQALQAHARNSRDAARGHSAAHADLELLTALAFALRDTMRRCGPPRREREGGGMTLELKPISHRGFAFEVKDRTFVWEDIAPHVRRLKRESPAFLDLLENPADLHWVMALRAQDALRELWGLMQPVEEAQLEPKGLHTYPAPQSPATARTVRARPVWGEVAVVEQGELPPYAFCLAVERQLTALRRDRQDGRELRRRWERGRCIIEVRL